MRQARLKQASKPRRVLLFLLFMVMLGGLHVFGMLIHRSIPWWLSVGWLVVTGFICWGGWTDDEDEPPPAWMSSPPLQRLGYLAVLLGGLAMCWLGWIGWNSRHDHMLGALMTLLGPIGVLWLLWLLGRLLSRLMGKR